MLGLGEKSYLSLRFPLLLCNTAEPVPRKPSVSLTIQEAALSLGCQASGLGQCQQVKIRVVKDGRSGASSPTNSFQLLGDLMPFLIAFKKCNVVSASVLEKAKKLYIASLSF